MMTSDNINRSAREDSAIRNYPRLIKRYARLLELNTEMVSTLELGDLLQHIAEAARELTESEASSILLYDPQTHHLYFEAATGPLEEGFSRTAVPIDHSIAGWIFTTGEHLLVEDTQRDPRFFAEVDVQTNFHTGSILGVPLQKKDKILGVIEVINKMDGKFSDEDLRLLQSLAAQAAITIENTLLFQQSDLIAEMVHELRTPLASLMAAAHLLHRQDLAQGQKTDLIQTVAREVQRLNEMTTNFLELARLESGRVHFLREPVHLEGLLLECLELIRPQAESQGLDIKTTLESGLTPALGDRNRLKQLLLNLLTNAIKYNRPNGTIKVSLQQDAGEYRISVEDTGKGIPADCLPHIFERFYRVPDQEQGATGTGLGLAIAKRIAQSHHGSIDVESEFGIGSKFILKLPGVRSSS